MINENLPTVQPTGILELDQILHGGIPLGSSILLSGSAGTGKTLLAIQWLFEGYKKYNEPGVYISLTEPVTKAIRNAKKMSFYDEKAVSPLQVYFTDLRGIMEGLNIDYQEMTFGDINQIAETIKLMVDQSHARRVVIDSITAMAYYLKERSKIRDFIFRLSTLLNQIDANVILTSEAPTEGLSIFGTEEFITDGVIRVLNFQKYGRFNRKLEVVKMRGTDYEAYPATFRITSDGLIFFPRLGRLLTYPVSGLRIPTGIEGLDTMISGGLFKGSASLISGPSGTGKSLLSLQYIITGLKAGEKTLYVSFEESQEQILHLAESFGWFLKEYLDSGQLNILCAYPEQLYLEEHIIKIKQIAEERQIDRVVVDSLSAIGTVYSKDSLPDFTARLISFFKQKGVTSVFTNATTSLMGNESITHAHLSTLYDNLFMLRFIEVESEIKHMLMILKMRGSKHDKKLREMVFSDQGLRISTPFTGYEGTMSGDAKKVGITIEDQLRELLIGTLGEAGEKIFEEEKKKGITLEKIQVILQDLTDQRIISRRRKEEFIVNFKEIVSK